jgi:hypothetical protein
VVAGIPGLNPLRSELIFLMALNIAVAILQLDRQ